MPRPHGTNNLSLYRCTWQSKQILSGAYFNRISNYWAGSILVLRQPGLMQPAASRKKIGSIEKMMQSTFWILSALRTTKTRFSRKVDRYRNMNIPKGIEHLVEVLRQGCFRLQSSSIPKRSSIIDAIVVYSFYFARSNASLLRKSLIVLLAPLIRSFLTILPFADRTAKWSGVSPQLLSWMFIQAPHASRALTAFSLPLQHAQCRGDEPLESSTCILNPLFKKQNRRRGESPWAAMCITHSPRALISQMSAPWSSNSLVILKLPLNTAQCRHVKPSLSFLFSQVFLSWAVQNSSCLEALDSNSLRKYSTRSQLLLLQQTCRTVECLSSRIQDREDFMEMEIDLTDTESFLVMALNKSCSIENEYTIMLVLIITFLSFESLDIVIHPMTLRGAPVRPQRDKQNNIQSYLPQFVRQSDVFNKEIKTILFRITNMETTNTNLNGQAVSSTVQNQPLVTCGSTQQEGSDSQVDRMQIQELRRCRLKGLQSIKVLRQKILGLQQEISSSAAKHTSEKDYLQQRMAKIEQQVETLMLYGTDIERNGRESSQSLQLQHLIRELHQRQTYQTSRLAQLAEEVSSLKSLIAALQTENGQLRAKLSANLGLQEKLTRQQAEILQLRAKDISSPDAARNLQVREGETQHLRATIQQLTSQITILKQALNKNVAPYNNSQAPCHYSWQVDHLNREIESLRRRVQDTQAKETSMYEQKLKLQRDLYLANAEVFHVGTLKSQLQSKRFQLQIGRSELARTIAEKQSSNKECRQLSNSVHQLEEFLRRAEHQKQHLQLRVQSAEAQNQVLRQLQVHLKSATEQLDRVRDKYYEVCKKESDTSLKYEILLREFQGTKNLISTTTHQKQRLSAALDNHLSARTDQLDQAYKQLQRALSEKTQLQLRADELEQTLKYNENKIGSFEDELIEFQRVYRQTQTELEQIRVTLRELQQLQALFLEKQPQLLSLLDSNNRSPHRHQIISPDANYKVQQRNNVYCQILGVLETQTSEIQQRKQLLLGLEERTQGFVSEVDRCRVQMATLEFQKRHLLNQNNATLEKLRWAEETLNQQEGLVSTQARQIQQLRGARSQPGEQETSRKPWMRNGFEAGTVQLEAARADRYEAIRKIKSILQQ